MAGHVFDERAAARKEPAAPKMMEEVCRLTLDCVFPAPPGHERVASAGSEGPEAPRRFRKLDVVVDLA